MTKREPTIADAKGLAGECRARGVIIIAFRDGGEFANPSCAGASYGHTRKDCDAMRIVLDQIVDMLGEGTIEVPESFGA